MSQNARTALDAPAHTGSRETPRGLCALFYVCTARVARAGTDVFFMQKEEEKMKKRVISLLLALVLALSLLPADGVRGG